MQVPDTIIERLYALESEVARLREARVIEARQRARREVYDRPSPLLLVQTWSEEDEEDIQNYPAEADAPNVYEFRSVDLDYTRTAGQQSIDTDPGDDVPEGLGADLRTGCYQYIPRGTICLATEHPFPNAQWALWPIAAVRYGGVAKVTESITAASDAGGVRTVGTGTVDLYCVSTGSSGPATLVAIDGGEDQTIYNTTTQTAGGEEGKFIQYKIATDCDGNCVLLWDVGDCA